MNKLEKFILEINNLSCCCLFCHRPAIANRILCQFCWNTILPYCGQNQRIIESLPFHSLIDWQSQKSDIVSILALNLKQNRNPRQWHYLAFLLLKNNPQIILNHSTVIVPSPARIHNDHDHAFCLSRALCEITHLPLHQLLLRPQTSKEQKKKKYSDRKKLTLELNENSTKFDDVIFVDDVVTTGSTALAAYQALNKPRHFQVLSLIQRSF